MDSTDKAPSKRVRVLYLILIWIPGGFFIWGLWILAWLLGVVFLLVGLWGSWDYLKQGDLFGDVDDAVGKTGEVVLRPYGESKARYNKR